MSNMSYCRFENTLHDLQDCYQALEDGALHDEDMDKTYERSSMFALVRLCKRIANDYGDEATEAEREAKAKG